MDDFMDFLLKMDKAFRTPFITALLTVGVIILKECFERWRHRKKREAEKLETYKIYATPLVNSASSLFWRLNEIFETRSSYLKNNAPSNSFNNYKYLSTIYRLIAVISWIRAIEKEISYIKFKSKTQNIKIKNALKELRIALSEGDHIELDRFMHVCRHFNIPVDEIDSGKQKKIGLELERIVWKTLYKENKEKPTNLDDYSKKQLVKEIYRLIEEEMNINPLSSDMLDSTKDLIIKEVTRTQAWIYRDWQNGIGDLMLSRDNDSIRKYDVKGFLYFETAFSNSNDEEKLWFARFEKVFKDLDITSNNRYDARPKQILKICKACVSIVTEFNNLYGKTPIIPKDKITEMNDFIKKYIK